MTVALLATFTADLILVYFGGAVHARATVGPMFFPVHAIATLLAAPSLAWTILAGRGNFSRWRPVVALLAWCIGVFAIFYQYSVAEDLYGIDGSGGGSGTDPTGATAPTGASIGAATSRVHAEARRSARTAAPGGTEAPCLTREGCRLTPVTAQCGDT